MSVAMYRRRRLDDEGFLIQVPAVAPGKATASGGIERREATERPPADHDLEAPTPELHAQQEHELAIAMGFVDEPRRAVHRAKEQLPDR
jgi:hypothetical protein